MELLAERAKTLPVLSSDLKWPDVNKVISLLPHNRLVPTSTGVPKKNVYTL